MADENYQKAVKAARVFKKVGAEWQNRPLSCMAAPLLVDDLSTRPANLKVLIEHPEKPKEAWAGLNLIAQTLLRDGKPLPASLAQWVADVLNGKPGPTTGADKMAIRDLIIQITVANLAATFQMSPTRTSTRGQSAGDGCSVCDAVAGVWGLGYKTVERIWNERQSHIRDRYDPVLPKRGKSKRTNT